MHACTQVRLHNSVTHDCSHAMAANSFAKAEAKCLCVQVHCDIISSVNQTEQVIKAVSSQCMSTTLFCK